MGVDTSTSFETENVHSSTEDDKTKVPGLTLELLVEVDETTDADGCHATLLPRDGYIYTAHVGSCEYEPTDKTNGSLHEETVKCGGGTSNLVKSSYNILEDLSHE